MSKRYTVRTLGCKANLYDSQLIEAELQKRGWLPAEAGSDSDLCIVNSCTVTDEADKQTRKMAARLARDNPDSRVVVTGCAAEVDPERLIRSKGIHYVIGNQDKPDLVNLILQKIESIAESEPQPAQGEILGSVSGYSEILSRHPMEREWPAATDSFFTPPVQLDGHSDKTRAFLKIQEGCNSFCTYCIIPYGRGPSRSLRPRELLAQVKALVAEGVREIVITGTNIGDYGADWHPQGSSDGAALVELLEMIFSETELPRLRVSSLDPTEITPGLLALMEREPRFCPHFHVSLQSPHSRILRLMKRKYDFEKVEQCLESIASLKRGFAFVGMDIITGFPGETDEEFEWGIEALSKLPWSRLHVFPYSEREGTPATRLPGVVPQEVRLERTRKLNDLSLARLTSIYREALSKLRDQGTSLDQVLLEKAQSRGEHAGWVPGYTPSYLRVMIPGSEISAGMARNQLISVTPMDVIVDRQSHDVAFVSRPQL